MNGKPEIILFGDGSKYYEMELRESKVIVYTPGEPELAKVVNYGFRAPFFLLFDDQVESGEQAKKKADDLGFSQVAKQFGTGIVFVRPVCGSFSLAKEGMYEEILEHARIGQFYEDSVTLGWNRFTKQWDENYIRGGVQRAYLYGKGAAGDYLAKQVLRTLHGQGLYGPGDVTPAVVVLDSIHTIPVMEREDIPIVSAGNTPETNTALKTQTKYYYEQETFDCVRQYEEFGKLYHRMVGNLIEEPDFEKVGFCMEACAVTLQVSQDNRGVDKEKEVHKVGYVAYYNKEILEKKEPVPLVLCFHGGGDSAMCMASVSGWYQVARKYGFLLVAVENHLESTATEMQELLGILKEKYPIHEEKIYASGFSMGGCKSWDMMQEYPKVFAAVAPMCATYEVGLNTSGEPAIRVNREELLPVFYVGGEQSPLPELPFQAVKCLDRMKYVLELNQCKKQNPYSFEDQSHWENKIYGISGEVTLQSRNPDRQDSVLTLELFESGNGKLYTVFGSVSDQQHEVRMHSCEHAYRFMNLFSRKKDGTLVGGEADQVIKELDF